MTEKRSENVVWRADYKPFGEEQSVTQAPENDMEFVGKEKDKETGLYYFGARYMRPEIGRFVTTDPVGPVDPRTSHWDIWERDCTACKIERRTGVGTRGFGGRRNIHLGMMFGLTKETRLQVEIRQKRLPII